MNAPLSYLIEKFKKAGQGHVFNFFEKLSDPLKQDFLSHACMIDLDRMHLLIESAKSKGGGEGALGNLMPVEVMLPLARKKLQDNTEIVKKGEEALRAGRVGALVVAGGQGTRLGFCGPKGLFPITPVKKKSFFQVFAEKIKVAQERYENIIPWFIMTSESNYKVTVDFFNQNNSFGLRDVYFFKQGVVPSIDLNGKFLLDEQGLIAMTPDGHGGCFEALVQSGLVVKMEERGIDVISYFQVDNPLVRCIDPLFIGLHLSAKSEMSSKVVEKIDPKERVGLFCKEGDHFKVVEYSQAPEELLSKRRPSGELFFNAGNIAVHLLDLKFIKKMGRSNGLPFHQTKKAISFLNERGELVVPKGLNSIRFEKLIFDALVEAKNVILMEVAREEEFSPVKNAEGEDSLESCRNDQLRQCVRWLKAVNVDIPCKEGGVPLWGIEISPLFGDTEDAFIAKWESLSQKPKIVGEVYLE